jgi:subtilisin family serine protease
MRKFSILTLFLLFLSACNVATGNTGEVTNPTQSSVVENPTQIVVDAPTSDGAMLPTHTPSSGGTEPETEATIPVPVTSSDDCQAVASASGIVIDAAEERADAPTTLPDGSPFPNVEPRLVGFGFGAQTASSGSGTLANQVIIQFTPESTTIERTAYIESIMGTIVNEIPPLNTIIVRLSRNSPRFELLPRTPIIVNLEADQTATAAQEPSIPNDPRFGEQWALPVVGLPQAWASVPQGSNVVVAVIDSGICANHPDLQGRLVAGYDFVQKDNDPTDVFGHGCGVAGVIAANANNGLGIAGIAPNVQIMPLRVLDGNGLGNYSNIALAIIYAVDNGANIINLSLAGSTSSPMMEQAVAYAVSRGVIVIAAAGNFGREGAFYPAAYPSVIAVGAVDPVTLARSSFSNYGADVDVYAPGRDILTTNMAGDYEMVSGTSFAAPIVAGITALSESLGAPLNTEDGIVFLYPPENLPNCP